MKRALGKLLTPPDLRARLASSGQDAKAWRALTPSARRMGAHWINGAKSPDVRDWRIADVLRRAHRYERGEGPFYPRNDEQHLLSRRGAGRSPR
ncbi:MAG: hypothetical protein E6I51_09155 [Chloroflexi bacterium]|nr:MAG: hypothetical protein E6I51_09155 [Chloroflexota bacterium]TMF27120.1 MAG: hypothetical protein E6I28_04885 [Chloroflexota bacterium]